MSDDVRKLAEEVRGSDLLLVSKEQLVKWADALARALLTALDERDRLKRRIKKLEDERRPGEMPHRCLNPDCGTTRYGTGYEACPGCGGTEGRAALSVKADTE